MVKNGRQTERKLKEMAYAITNMKRRGEKRYAEKATECMRRKPYQ